MDVYHFHVMQGSYQIVAVVVFAFPGCVVAVVVYVVVVLHNGTLVVVHPLA